MKLKREKENFLHDLEQDVKNSILDGFVYYSNSYYGSSSINLNEVISTAVALGIRRAMEKLIEEQYTDEDFENDIGLKD